MTGVAEEEAVWPCRYWPVDTECCPGLPSDPTQWTSKQRASVEIASETLWRLTAGRYGLCGEITRPCARPCASDGYTADGVLWPGSEWMSPVLFAEGWRNIACGCTGTGCSCGPLEEVELGGPVYKILEVTVDGVLLDPAAYVVQNERFLVRVDGGTWPRCQHLDRPLTQPGTFGVKYLRGKPPPAGAARVMGTLVCEILKQCNGDNTCRLPARTQSVDREGISFEIFDPSNPADWLIGLPEIRGWLGLLNPQSRLSKSSVWSPDFPIVRSDMFKPEDPTPPLPGPPGQPELRFL